MTDKEKAVEDGEVEGAEVSATFWDDLAWEVATWPKLSAADFVDDPEPMI